MSTDGPVIGFMNGKAPRIYGASNLHISRFTHTVDCTRPLPRHLVREPDEVTREIAKVSADLIPDGANLQLGVGEIPDAVGMRLIAVGKQDLGFFTETFSDAAPALDNAGLLKNNHPLFKGKSLTSFVAGDKVLDYVDKNEDVIFLPSHIIN